MYVKPVIKKDCNKVYSRFFKAKTVRNIFGTSKEDSQLIYNPSDPGEEVEMTIKFNKRYGGIFSGEPFIEFSLIGSTNALSRL